jgi:hypothetical protein
VLYDKKQHEPLAGGAWDERIARYAIADIVDEARGGDPLDEAGLYAGRAGETWALRALGENVDIVADAGPDNSYADGELGIALAAGDRERARAVATIVVDDPWNELLYGAGGALVVATLLDLDDVARLAIERLWSTWTFDSKLRACIWTQSFDGKTQQFLGMAHGLAGNVYALLRAGGFQSAVHQRELLDRTVDVLKRRALTEKNAANWLPSLQSTQKELRVQWCHGAPGIRRSHLARRAAQEGRGALPRHRRQRLGVSEAASPHARREVAGARAALRDARDQAAHRAARPARG